MTQDQINTKINNAHFQFPPLNVFSKTSTL